MTFETQGQRRVDSADPDGENLVRRLAGTVDPARISTDLMTRMAYARDASPLALKMVADGLSPYVPRAVVWPESTAEVQGIMRVAASMRIPLVPYGGGSGIVGGALPGHDAVIVDTKRLDRITDIDVVSMSATVGAGILGSVLEDRLNARGLTCGHVPQSMNSSTVGGWIAHRGVGAFSTKYGRIQDLLLSIEVVLPDGDVVRTRTVPASAAGPDLNAWFVGAEGTLGIVTAATLQVFPMPAIRIDRAFAVPSFRDGLDAVRRIVQRGLRPAVIRVYDPAEARDRFGPSVADGWAVVLMIAEGDPALTELTLAEAGRELGSSAADLGESIGASWLAERTNTAGLCRVLAQSGGFADALEVANVWSRLADTYDRMKAAMEEAVGPTGRVFGHASHFYHSGGNLYVIFDALADDPREVGRRYEEVLSAAFDACHAEGGTLTHHHGVGRTKQAWLEREWGPGGLKLWQQTRHAIDPDGLMNPGTLRG